jgi:NADPH:quinone reductase
VFEFGALRNTESLLVHGGGSGIGVTAIPLAATLGHQVFTTAGSDEKCRRCEALGATRAINYRSEDFVAAVRAATQDRGVDVILDMVGGDYLPRNLNALAPQGRLVVIATQGGHSASIDLRKVMMNRLQITGSTLRPRPLAFKQAIKGQLLTRVWPLLASGQLRPIVERIYSFAEAAAAHRHMESNTHFGKILMTWETRAL